MKWNLEVTSKEMIKPSAPTPPHLCTHTLSWFDCLFEEPIDFILFYSPTSATTTTTSSTDHLKACLSQTLSLFRPVAGRLNSDATAVDCNDRGVELIEARATSNAPLSRLVASPDVADLRTLRTLLPPRLVGQGPLLKVQITSFASCGGGVAVGVSFSHRLADGQSVMAFLTTWAAIASRRVPPPPPIFDTARLFPPPCTCVGETLPKSLDGTSDQHTGVTKRFVFWEPAITRLRDQYSSSSSSVDTTSRLSRAQAVMALLWRCCLRAREKARRRRCCSVAIIVATMRGRALPDELFGNLICLCAAAMGGEDDDRHPWVFEERVRKAIRGIDVERLRRFRGGDEWALAFTPVMEATEELCGGGGSSLELVTYVFASWNRFPFSKLDLFGLGEPVWVGVGINNMNEAILTDISGGDGGGGIEAWLTLEEDEMKRLADDEEINAFASH